MKKAKSLFVLVMCLVLLMIPFVTTAEDVSFFGDVDDDGVLTTTDARLVLMFSAMKSIPYPHESDMYKAMQALRQRAHTCADVDGDGVLTTTDARLILQYVVGKIDRFPVEE